MTMNSILRLASVEGIGYMTSRLLRALHKTAPCPNYWLASHDVTGTQRCHVRRFNFSTRWIDSSSPVRNAGVSAGTRRLGTEGRAQQLAANEKQEAKKLAKAEKQRLHLDRLKVGSVCIFKDLEFWSCLCFF